jgi:hypothetical protein
VVERLPSHTRSFSSEKILQEFRELQRAGQAHAQAQQQAHTQAQLLGQSVSMLLSSLASSDVAAAYLLLGLHARALLLGKQMLLWWLDVSCAGC